MKALPPDFKERAFRHIMYLAGLGARVAGTENEAKAIAYVRQQLEELGIPVVVETFEKGQSQFPVQVKNRALDGQQNNWKMIANCTRMIWYQLCKERQGANLYRRANDVKSRGRNHHKARR